MNFGYLSVTALLASLAIGGRATAQVTEDPSLGAESTVVNLAPGNGGSTYTITGGATRGTNLFHSFDQFSIMAGDRAAFDHVNQIENIIGRVTGANISNLDGIIQANDGANLFLINPAGIVLGPDARLDIGGSFIATTGQGISFDNGFTYDTTSPNVPPLLTISTPTGLLMGANPGNIQAMGQGGNTPLDFSVNPGQTLALIGGNVSLTGVQLTAEGGRLELGGVSPASELSLTPIEQGFDIGFDGVSAAGTILLSGQTGLDVSGPGGGTIELYGDEVTLAGQSALVSDTLGGVDGQQIRVVAERFRLQDGSFIGAAISGSGNGSHIDIVADQEITLIGTDIFDYKILQILSLAGLRQISDRQNGGLFTVTTGTGQAGNISLSTQNLLINEGISVSAETLGAGDSGNIEIVATDSIRLRGSGISSNSIIPGIPLIDLEGTATGQSTVGIPAGAAGNVTVNTTNLTIEDGAAIAAATQTDQDSGNVIITATDSLILRGFFEEIPIPTSITTVTIGGLGDAGNIQIETGRLVVQDGSAVFADSGSFAFKGIIPFGGASGSILITATDSIDIVGGQNIEGFFFSGIGSQTFSDEPAGTMRLTTPVLTVRDGGRITSTTFGSGQGGAIEIESDVITISGTGEDSDQFTSGIFASSGIENKTSRLGRAVDPASVTGAGGVVSIDTTTLTVQEMAEISVASLGEGIAGNLTITADTVRLDSQGVLTAATVSGAGGNINLASDVLALDSGNIRANAGSNDGGNLVFDLDEVLLLRNGSLISTEAGTAGAGGNGGDITLNIPNGFIVAVPTENSDIRANAFEGDGGNVDIAARNLLGIAFRPGVLDTPLSDITASSRFGSSGIVTIDELNPETLQSDIELPTDIVTSTLAEGCQARGAQTGSFIRTGHGGLPTNPADSLSAESVWQDLAPLDLAPASEPVRQMVRPDAPMVEAQGWTSDDDGTVTLVAHGGETSGHFTPTGGCSFE